MEIAVHATRDPQASVWVAESDDFPGLVAEADDIETLVARLKILIPELLDANGVAVGEYDEIAFVLTANSARAGGPPRRLMADDAPRVRRLLREAASGSGRARATTRSGSAPKPSDTMRKGCRHQKPCGPQRLIMERRGPDGYSMRARHPLPDSSTSATNEWMR